MSGISGWPFTAQTTSPAASSAASPNAALITTLKTAPSQVDRVKALGDNFIFDFRGTLGVSEGRGGKTVAANARTFPALIGNGIAMTVGYLGPCGINLPHTHPRATEFNFVASVRALPSRCSDWCVDLIRNVDTQGAFEAGFFMENGNEFVLTNVTQGMAVVFPQGAIHFEQNMNCEPAVFVAGFNNEDPGVSTIANNFFGLPTAVSSHSPFLHIVEACSSLCALSDCRRFSGRTQHLLGGGPQGYAADQPSLGY